MWGRREYERPSSFPCFLSGSLLRVHGAEVCMYCFLGSVIGDASAKRQVLEGQKIRKWKTQQLVLQAHALYMHM